MKQLPLRSALALTAICSTASLSGAGFYLSEVGTPGSLGTAGVGNVVNNFAADSAWTNPAGMTGVHEDQIMMGASVIAANIRFDASSKTTADGGDGGNAGEVVAAPGLFGTKKITDELWVGMGIAGTSGGGMNYDNDWAGRYGATDVELMGIGFSPSAAYKISDKLSIGAGVSIIYTQFSETIAINKPMDSDGRVKFDELDDWGYQPFAGIQFQLTEQLLLGVVYRAEMDVDLEGDIKFRNMPAATANDMKLSWDNPQTIEAALRYDIDEHWMVAVNGGWQDWSIFSKNQIDVDGPAADPATLDRNWQDTWHAGIAAAYTVDNSRYSVGFSYESSPVEDEDRTVDLPMDEQFKFSASYAWDGHKQWSYAVGATLYYLGDGKIEEQNTQGVIVDGEYDTNYMIIAGMTARYRF
jgi:long-chain fatty acid transport protein